MTSLPFSDGLNDPLQSQPPQNDIEKIQALLHTPGLLEVFSKLLGMTVDDARLFLKETLKQFHPQNPAEELILTHVLLSHFQSLKVMELCECVTHAQGKERYINMYSRLQGVMRRWLSLLAEIKNSGDKTVELIYTFNQLNVTPPSEEKCHVQNGRRFNNFKHGLRSKRKEYRYGNFEW